MSGGLFSRMSIVILSNIPIAIPGNNSLFGMDPFRRSNHAAAAASIVTIVTVFTLTASKQDYHPPSFYLFNLLGNKSNNRTLKIFSEISRYDLKSERTFEVISIIGDFRRLVQTFLSKKLFLWNLYSILKICIQKSNKTPGIPKNPHVKTVRGFNAIIETRFCAAKNSFMP